MFVWQVTILILSPHNRTFFRGNPACVQSICSLNIALKFLVPDTTSLNRDLSSDLARAVPNPPPIVYALAQQRGNAFPLQGGCQMLSVLALLQAEGVQPHRLCCTGSKQHAVSGPHQTLTVPTQHAQTLQNLHFPLLCLFFKAEPLTF